MGLFRVAQNCYTLKPIEGHLIKMILIKENELWKLVPAM